MRPRDRRSGFTLIEILVVLVIMGLTLAIVARFVPRPNATLQLANATSRVADAMRLARARAVAEDHLVAFALTRDGHGFSVGGTPVPLGPAVGMAMAGPRVIVFAPDGSASGGTLRITVAAKARLIRVNWLTGQVTVEAVS